MATKSNLRIASCDTNHSNDTAFEPLSLQEYESKNSLELKIALRWKLVQTCSPYGPYDTVDQKLIRERYEPKSGWTPSGYRSTLFLSKGWNRERLK